MGKFPIGKVTFFATSNIHKFNEARTLFSEFNVSVAMLKVKALEIQDINIENIAVASVLDAVKKSGLPMFVEDAGFFVKALAGFPGPYSSFVFQTISTKGILKLMKDVDERDAYFHSVVAFCKPKKKPVVFHGKVMGEIVYEEKGKGGFGFDPIFTPLKGNCRTFAEMPVEEKNRFSHRAEALRKFVKWYTSQRHPPTKNS